MAVPEVREERPAAAADSASPGAAVGGQALATAAPASTAAGRSASLRAKDGPRVIHAPVDLGALVAADGTDAPAHLLFDDIDVRGGAGGPQVAALSLTPRDVLHLRPVAVNGGGRVAGVVLSGVGVLDAGRDEVRAPRGSGHSPRVVELVHVVVAAASVALADVLLG